MHKDDIKTNLGKIDANNDDISSNLKKIDAKNNYK